MHKQKLVGTIYILFDILPVVAELSRVFQKNIVDFNSVQPSLQRTKDKLQSIGYSTKFKEVMKLDKILLKLGLGNDDVSLTLSSEDDLVTFLKKYGNALCGNIDKRFKEATPVLTSFRAFDPLNTPK